MGKGEQSMRKELEYAKKIAAIVKLYHSNLLSEKENINTLDMNGEMLLTILSSLSQGEVESLSENVKLGLRMKMKRGELIGFNGCMGYDYHPDTKSITVNEQEAETDADYRK
jgi:DNA invertase Pin-like site-specific DNA recombinase